MEFLSAAEMRSRSDEIRRALEAVLSSRAIAARRNAKQWRFVSDCLARALSPETPSEFDGLPPPQAAQLKFAAQDRLRRFYNEDRKKNSLEITLVHRDELGLYRTRGPATSYPALASYCLMVRDPRLDPTVQRDDLVEAYLERVVAEAMDAELDLYRALPLVDPALLEPWWYKRGPGFREAMARARQRLSQGWILSNPQNPSTRRLLFVRLRRRSKGAAVASSREYWNLRWWSPKLGDYVYAYRRTGHYRYELRRVGSDWKIFQKEDEG